MSEVQIQDIYSRLDSLTREVNSLKVQMGVVGTSQAAIAQIYTRLDTFAETTNSNFAQVTQRFDRIEGRLERVETTQETHTQLLNEILRILRDVSRQALRVQQFQLDGNRQDLNCFTALRLRNGGSGL